MSITTIRKQFQLARSVFHPCTIARPSSRMQVLCATANTLPERDYTRREALLKWNVQEDGNALLEFSLTMPLVILLFLGAMDLAFVIQQNIMITDAAVTGARYGANGHMNDLTGMQAAATSAASGVQNFSVTAVNFCTCTPGGPTVSCASSCGATAPLQYAKITTNASCPLLFKVQGLPVALPLSYSSTMRVN